MSATEQTATLPKIEHTAEMLRVCFVCTGNTCRSPMAEAAANALAQGELKKLPESLRSLATPRLEAFSAGIYAREGDPIAENAVLALEEAEISPTPNHDYKTHTAHYLTADEAAEFDLLIGLTREHAMALLLRFPHLAQKITFFPTDVPDPYGGSPEDYRICLRQITDGVISKLFSEDLTS